MPNTTTTLYFNEEKKHSVRYDAKKTDEQPVMTSAYVSKTALEKPWPAYVIVTIQTGGVR